MGRALHHTHDPPSACCAADYLAFLQQVTPENQEEYMAQMRRFNLGPVGEADCPVFDGMFEYFRVRPPQRARQACCVAPRFDAQP